MGGTGEAKFLALASGLWFGAAEKAVQDLAAEFLSGLCEDPQLKALGNAVQRLVVCGGLIAPEEELRKQAAIAEPNEIADKGMIKLRSLALAEADNFFAKLSKVVP